MSITLSNLASLSLVRQVSKNAEELDKTQQRLATGKKNLSLAENAADHAIFSRAEAKIRGLQGAKRNAEDAQGTVQVAENGLNEVSNYLIRLKELALQATSDFLSDQGRESIVGEAKMITSSVDRIARTTRRNGNNLLDGSGSAMTFLVDDESGEDSLFVFRPEELDARSDTLHLEDIDLEDEDSALDTLAVIDEALEQVNAMRIKTAGYQFQMESRQRVLDSKILAEEKRKSLIGDADLAKEASNYARQQLQLQASISVLAQANVMQKSALRLLEPPGTVNFSV